MQKRESPDFRFLGVGISATVQKSTILRDVTKRRFSSGYHVTGSNFSRQKRHGVILKVQLSKAAHLTNKKAIFALLRFILGYHAYAWSPQKICTKP